MLASEGLATRPDGSLRWTGGELAGSADATCLPVGFCFDPTVACAENCERRAFRLELPGDFWATREGRLEATVGWGTRSNVSFTTQLRDASGQLVAHGEEGWYNSVIVLEQPAPGAYELAVLAVGGRGPYEASLRLSARDRGEPRDLLPNLVTLPPTDLMVAYADGRPAPLWTVQEAVLGSKGCRTDEAVEQQAKRCLRLTNRVGNAGDGPLEVRLELAQGAAGLVGEGRFVQRIHRTDGMWHDEPVGGAVFHPVHGHYHYAGLAHYTVHRVDATGGRGPALNEGQKSGFCFEDSGLLDLGLPFTDMPTFAGRGCADPSQEQEWFMGVGAKWFDEYYWGLAEQYVDITGAPDGIYELVSVANGAGTLIETDPADNGASVRFRLTGDEVEVLPSEG